MDALVKHDWSLQHGTSYSISSDVDMEYWDDWFLRVAYENYRRISTKEMTDLLYIINVSVHTGKLPGYEFLANMEEWDAESWIRRAHRDCHKLHMSDPIAFPAGGLKDSFDRIRAVRKAKRANKEVQQ